MSHLVSLVAKGNISCMGVGAGPLALAACTCTLFHADSLTRGCHYLTLRVEFMSLRAGTPGRGLKAATCLLGQFAVRWACSVLCLTSNGSSRALMQDIGARLLRHECTHKRAVMSIIHPDPVLRAV